MVNQIILFPRGQLSVNDKARLTRLGITWIEADVPGDVVTVPSSKATVSEDEMFKCAMETINYFSGNVTADFSKRLMAIINAKRAK